MGSERLLGKGLINLGLYKLSEYINEDSDSYKLLDLKCKYRIATLVISIEPFVDKEDKSILGMAFSDHICINENLNEREYHVICHELGHILTRHRLYKNDLYIRAYLSEVNKLNKLGAGTHLCKFREAYCEVFAYIMEDIEYSRVFPKMYSVLCDIGVFDDICCSLDTSTHLEMDYARWYIDLYGDTLYSIGTKLVDLNVIDFIGELAVMTYVADDKDKFMSYVDELLSQHFTSKYTEQELLEKYKPILYMFPLRGSRLAQELFSLENEFGEKGVLERKFVV